MFFFNRPHADLFLGVQISTSFFSEMPWFQIQQLFFNCFLNLFKSERYHLGTTFRTQKQNSCPKKSSKTPLEDYILDTFFGV